MPHSSSSCILIKTTNREPFIGLVEALHLSGWLGLDSYSDMILKSQEGESWLLLKPTFAKPRRRGPSASRTKGSSGKRTRATSTRRKS